MQYGWIGKILWVDLTKKELTYLDTMKYVPQFLGGKGVSIKIAWDILKGDVKPYDAANILVFMTGPLTGTLAPTSGRGMISSVSPRVYPKPWYTRSNVGGYWAPELKYAGYDGLIIYGKADYPVYLLVNDGKATIEDARELWGKGTIATQRALKDLYGEGVQVLCIGPAGENLVRFSTIQHNLSNASGQAGFGAVMGSKRLKAVVLRGTGGVAIAQPSQFLEACIYAEELVRNGPNIFHILSPKASPPEKVVCSASCPCNCEAVAKRNISARLSSGNLTMLEHCMYPGFGWNRTEYKRPETPEIKTEGTPGFGEGIDVQCLIEDLGLSIWEYFNFYPWFEVFVRNGVEKIGGLQLDINEPRFWFQFFRMIAYREGVCDILSESVLRASERLGELGVPEQFWEEIKRIARFEQPAYGFPAHRLGRAAESQPSPLWIFSMLHWAFDTRDPMSSHHQSAFLEYIMPPHHGVSEPSAKVPFKKLKATYKKLFGTGEIMEPGFEPMEDKVRCAIWHQHRSCIKDSLLLCDWIFPRTFSSFSSQEEIDNAEHLAGDIDIEAKLFSPATGVQMNSKDLEKCGERIYNLERALHIRNYDRSRTTDETIRWFCELPEKTDGTKLNADIFRTIIDTYYNLRGWDTENGMPTEQKLKELGIEDIANEIFLKNETSNRRSRQ
jgi:aldehyde:ferredoxin oxidoreductase